MDAIYKLKFGWLKFGEARTTRQIHQTFPLPNIPAIRYIQSSNHYKCQFQAFICCKLQNVLN